MPVALQYTKSFIKERKSLGMKNVFSKSTPEFDFQKFFNLILTEQRCQRVDLARLTKLLNIIIGNISPDEPTQREEVPDDPGSSTGD